VGAIASSGAAPKVVIVAGASRGIGAAIARGLAAAVVADIRAEGGTALAVQSDVSTHAGVAALFDAAEATFGDGAASAGGSAETRPRVVHAIVNNAGIGMPAMLSIADTPDDLVDSMLAVNTKSVLYALKEASARLRDGGRVVNISTTIVATSVPGYGVYGASKAAVEALTRIAAKELGTAARRITVNAVAPGPVSTELFFAGKTEAMVARMAAAAPAGRIGEPAEIAGIVAFLVGPDSAWVNGQVIRVNGGVA